MTSGKIIARIGYYEDLASEAREKLAKDREDLANLKILSKKAKGAVEDFGDMRDEKLQSLSAAEHMGNVRSAGEYHDGMHDLLKGDEFSSAYISLSDDEAAIERARRSLEDEISELEGKISSYRQEISGLWRQYAAAVKAEMGE